MNLSFWAGVAVTIIAILGYREYQEIKNIETVVYESSCFDCAGNTKSWEELSTLCRKFQNTEKK